MRALLALTLSLVLAVPASAQSANRQTHAVQCLMAMSVANGAASRGAAANPTAAEAAKLGMLIFTAELIGMNPNLDLTAAVRGQLAAFTRERLQALLPQCGTEIQTVHRRLSAIGDGLKQAQPPAKP
jgi:hypothetical protein